MDSNGLNQLMNAMLWGSSCQSSQSHAMAMANLCSQQFGELILQETHKLISRNPPTTAAELQLLNSEKIQLSSKIGSISHADSMARTTPEVATEIYNATKSFCDNNVLTSDCISPGIELSSQISHLCHTATMRRITGR
tara:strand:+ start:2010 stop:2423 length:414 start_codon:yes stop_codon:yes gene_type:complete